MQKTINDLKDLHKEIKLLMLDDQCCDISLNLQDGTLLESIERMEQIVADCIQQHTGQFPEVPKDPLL